MSCSPVCRSHLVRGRVRVRVRARVRARVRVRVRVRVPVPPHPAHRRRSARRQVYRIFKRTKA